MRSVFLGRILLVLVVTVLLASLLMTGGYIYLSRDAYASIKLAELTPEAKTMGSLFVEYRAGAIEEGTFKRLLDNLMLSSNATGIVTDAQGRHIYDTISRAEFQFEEDYQQVEEQIASALVGTTHENKAIRMADDNDALSVCIPIRTQDGTTLGSVYLLKSPTEIKNATSRMNGILVLVIVVVAPVMLLISSLSARRLAEPLHRMSDVAIRMSKGDFEVRADEEEAGEVGVLARALNNLCITLSESIYQLRAEKSQLRHVLASLSEGVAATDNAGCLTLYNPALMHMFGAVRVGTREELIQDEAIWNAFDEVYRAGEPQSIKYPMSNERMLWITMSPIVADDGERTGVVGLFKDMTEAENLERSRRDYIQNISHELRTPLTAMRGLLEPLSDGMVKNEEDKQRYYKIMLREVLRLSRLITDMMQLSRLQAGTEYMEFAETDINELLEDVCINYSKEANEHGIKLELSAPKLPHVLTDADRVGQILVILLSNAMRYTPEGGTITLKGMDGPRVTISVVDTGVGIEEEDLAHVFDRFYTADKSRKEGHTGLGLSIAEQMIDKLGEKIHVASKVGEGTRFTFTLKKFVSNAIALGPANDDWTDIMDEPTAPHSVMEHDVKRTRDALFEVLPSPEKKKKRAGKAEE